MNNDYSIDVLVFLFFKLYDVYVTFIQVPVASGLQQQVAKAHVVCCDHLALVSRKL
jgi:hypothetical protein